MRKSRQILQAQTCKKINEQIHEKILINLMGMDLWKKNSSKKCMTRPWEKSARTCEKLISAIHEKIQTNHTGRPVKKFIKENSSENLDKPHRHKPVKKLVHSWENPNKSNRHEPVNKLVQNIFDKIPTNHSGTDLWKNVWKN